jgi:molybdenum cofactor cytidylyltransferase
MRAISAVLIAAGESVRMGRPKPLLSWHGVPLVEYQAAALVEAGVAEVVVVLGHRHELVGPHVKGPGVHYVVNRAYRLGKTGSVKAGLGGIESPATDVLLLAVDQPRPAGVVSSIIEAHVRADALITAPSYRGRAGHPLVFSSSLMCELQAITEDGQGVREVFLAHRADVNEVEMDDPIVCLDLNSPEAYEEAKARYGA